MEFESGSALGEYFKEFDVEPYESVQGKDEITDTNAVSEIRPFTDELTELIELQLQNDFGRLNGHKVLFPRFSDSWILRLITSLHLLLCKFIPAICHWFFNRRLAYAKVQLLQEFIAVVNQFHVDLNQTILSIKECEFVAGFSIKKEMVCRRLKKHTAVQILKLLDDDLSVVDEVIVDRTYLQDLCMKLVEKRVDFMYALRNLDSGQCCNRLAEEITKYKHNNLADELEFQRRMLREDTRFEIQTLETEATPLDIKMSDLMTQCRYLAISLQMYHESEIPKALFVEKANDYALAISQLVLELKEGPDVQDNAPSTFLAESDAEYELEFQPSKTILPRPLEENENIDESKGETFEGMSEIVTHTKPRPDFTFRDHLELIKELQVVMKNKSAVVGQ